MPDMRCSDQEDHRCSEPQEVLGVHQPQVWSEEASMKPGPGAPVIGLDIDGTCGDYHGHFTRFAQEYTGKQMPPPDQYTGGIPFHKHLGMSRTTYNKVKLAYRQGGAKRSMPPYPGIGEFTKCVRTCGVAVYICTTRPYLRLDNIDPDTRHWLKDRAHMQYDAVLWGAYKYNDLIKQVGRERVVMVYDDLPALVSRADSLGLPAAIRTQPYNVGWSSGNIVRVDSVLDMRLIFLDALSKWKENHQ